MLGAERLLVDRQRALEERPRRRQVALSLQQEGEVVEAHRRLRMLGAERLLTDRQRVSKQRFGRRMGSSAVKIAACPVQKDGTLRALGGVCGLSLAGGDQMRR